MGLIVPANFEMSMLRNKEERLVVEAHRDRLSDGWLITPDVGMTGTRDRHTDVVIAHEREGVAVIEVKGHRPKMRGGVWCSDGVPMDPQPLAQAKDNTHRHHRRVRRRAVARVLPASRAVPTRSD